jgi:predicted nucleic acid-binding protein
MRYLLDTGPLAALLLGRPGAIRLFTPWIRSQEVATSIVVYGEVVEYIKGLPNFSVHRAGLHNLLMGVNPYFLSYHIMERYADLRRALRPPHGPGLIGDMDVLIAATALEQRLTLVTLDGDHQRVPGLHVMLLTRDQLRQ